MPNIFNTIISSTGITPAQFLICLGVALLLGVFFAFIHNVKNTSSASFTVTLGLLPAIVAVIIMMVNGNIGAGVAVAGAFSLVKFRSAPGNAREIGTLFMAMASGLIVGMGLIGYAILFSVVMGLAELIFSVVGSKIKPRPNLEKTLRITIPEDLNYEEIFEDILNNYTEKYELISVKTTNMGSMYKLHYNITMKENVGHKELIDQLRCRNGNLEISICKQEVASNEL